MSKVKMSEESLKALRLPELQAKYAAIVGEPTRTPNKAWLVRKILGAAKTRATAAKKQTAAPKTSTSTKTQPFQHDGGVASWSQGVPCSTRSLSASSVSAPSLS